MAKEVQLFITFVMISMLISTEAVGAKRPLIKCIELVPKLAPCTPKISGICLTMCKTQYNTTIKGTCKVVPKAIRKACECEYMAVECPRKL
ncbi:hypothetical protein Bca4012_015809 [Brassica carinata]